MVLRIDRYGSTNVWQILRNFSLIVVGSAICVVAINGILVPHGFLSGGFAGLALVIYYLTPVLPVGMLYFLLNIPLFAMGWRYVGRRFFLYSISGMFVFSACLKWIHVTVPVNEPILAALLAGIISGIGSGIILRSAGSAGGMDILAVMLLQRFTIRLGSTSLALNSVILTVGAALFSLERSLYALIYIFVSAHMVNLVVSGFHQRKAVFIISQQKREIADEISTKLNRGLTFIKARGGYTGQQEEIIYTVVTFRELPRVKEIIRHWDPKAFMVVTETLEVMGHRIGNQPHW